MTERIGRAWRRVPAPVRAPFTVVGRTFHVYMDDSCSTYAAAIAYYSIFSLVPLALIILSIFGLVVPRQDITQFVFEQFPLQETEAVHTNVDNIVARAQDISAAGLGFGILALIWSSSGIFSAVRRGLNAASDRKEGRPYWHGKLIDVALIPCLGLLIILAVGLTAASQVVIERVGSLGPLDFDTNLALRVSSYVVPAVISFVMFAMLYRYVPTARPRWPEAITGAVFATFLFEVTKNFYALVFSLTAFSKDTAIYAGFGNALGVLLLFFLTASILLLGAEFGRALFAPAFRAELLDQPDAEASTPTVGPVRPPAHRAM
jgi:membrane protein